MRCPARRLAALILLAGPGLVAQLPPHAVLLNPSGVSLFDPMILRSGDTVHAFGWHSSVSLGFLHYARSLDGGRTWPVREMPLASGSAMGRCAIDGDHVHALVLGQWLGPHVVSSHDGGATWSLPVRVSQQTLGSPAMSLESLIHVDGNTVNVVWPENRTGGRLWANRSLDGGVTWQPADTALDVGLTPVVWTPDHTLRLVAEGPTLHVFWTRNGPLPYAVHQHSFDGGATWLPAASILLNAPLRDVAGSGSTLLATCEYPNGFFRSVDHGASWTQIIGHGLGQVVDYAIDGQRVLAVAVVGQMPVATIQLGTSADGGASWLPVPYTIQAMRVLQLWAHVVGDAMFVQFRFQDQLLPRGTVIQSDDFGGQWRALSGEAATLLMPTTDSCMVVTWGANRDVHAYVIEGHTALGRGTTGTGAIEPKLAGHGLPGLGRTFALDVDGARGGSLGAYFATFGLEANVPMGTATLYLQQPIGPFVFLTSGAAGAPGVGTASLPITVPTSTSFAGLRLLSQAFVLDPASADGFTATRAVETWIR